MATVVVRFGFLTSRTLMIKICSYKSALAELLALPLTTSAPGLVAVAAQRRRIKDICTRIRPWRAFGSNVQCPRMITCKSATKIAFFSFTEVSKPYVGVRYVGIHCHLVRVIWQQRREQLYISYIMRCPVTHVVASHVCVFGSYPPPITFDRTLLLDAKLLDPVFEICFKCCGIAKTKGLSRI